MGGLIGGADGWGLWVQLMGGAGVCSGRLQLGMLSSCSAISCSVVSSSASRPGHLKKMASQRLSSKRMERGRGRQMERERSLLIVEVLLARLCIGGLLFWRTSAVWACVTW